jgi:mannose-6-phosphate isomerase
MIRVPPPSVKVEKHWGYFEQYTHNPPCTLKIVTVTACGTLSCQYHRKRDGLWVVPDPGARVEIGGEVVHPEVDEKRFVLRETGYRSSSAGVGEVRVLGISFGEFD